MIKTLIYFYFLFRYLKTLFSDETLHITRVPTVNPNEFILTSDRHSHPHHQHRHHHHHHHRHHHRSQQNEKSRPSYPPIHNEKKENNLPPLSPHRSIPSMGTSHAILRNSQIISKDDEIYPLQEIKTLPNNQDSRVSETGLFVIYLNNRFIYLIISSSKTRTSVFS